MIVVKLGGSLAESGTLVSWLATLAERGVRNCVLVPGGGAFADTVREAQKLHGFSDRAAHRMALLAMEQYAFMLADLEPALMPCARADEMEAALGRGRIPVWLPSDMVLASPSIAESWEVTSDSLAAWLAQRLGACRLVLIKSACMPAGSLSPKDLARCGFVDAAFPDFVSSVDFDIVWLGPGEQHRLDAALCEVA